MTWWISGLDLENLLVLSGLPQASVVTRVALPVRTGWPLTKSAGEQLGLTPPGIGQAQL